MADFKYELPKRGYGTNINPLEHVCRNARKFGDWKKRETYVRAYKYLKGQVHGNPGSRPSFKYGQWVKVTGHTKDDEGVDNYGSIGFVMDIMPDYIEIFIENGYWQGHVGGYDRQDLMPIPRPSRISERARYWLKKLTHKNPIGDTYGGTPPKKCDVCEGPITTKFIDGKTARGPWGNMCPACHSLHGVGLGVGKGQEYTRKGGKWVLTAGSTPKRPAKGYDRKGFQEALGRGASFDELQDFFGDKDPTEFL